MKILVTGARGRVGRHLVQQLVEAGYDVRVLTRDPDSATFPDGVEVIKGDLTMPETLEQSLEGVSGLHLIKFGGHDYAPLQTGHEIMAMAEKAGVQRVTVLMGGERGDFEEAVEASSLAWTFLVPVEFMTGALDWAASIRDEGVVREAFADRKTAIVHEADIAAVAVVALTQDGHGGQTYTITGPEVQTPRQMVRIIASVLERNIPFIELTPEQAVEKWRSEGLPQEVIDFFLWVHGNTPPVGYTVTSTVEEVTGRPAFTFVQWAVENADQFRSRD